MSPDDQARKSGAKANERAKAELAKASAAPATGGGAGGGESRPKTIRETLAEQTDEIRKALPGMMDAERFVRLVLTTVRRSPELQQCSQVSLIAACMLCAQLGLEPGPLGHAWLVPFWNGKTKIYEVQFILGYRGMIHLSYGSEKISSIEARDVRENDVFDFEYGLDGKLVHRPKLNDRGDPIAFYCVAKFRDGGHYFNVLSREDVEARRSRSMSGRGDTPVGPWLTDYDSMGRKSAIRASQPYLPLSVLAAEAFSADETVPTRIESDMVSVMAAQGPPEIAEESGDVDQETAPTGEASTAEEGNGGEEET